MEFEKGDLVVIPEELKLKLNEINSSVGYTHRMPLFVGKLLRIIDKSYTESKGVIFPMYRVEIVENKKESSPYFQAESFIYAESSLLVNLEIIKKEIGL